MNRQNAMIIVSKMVVVTTTISLGFITLESQVANAVRSYYPGTDSLLKL